MKVAKNANELVTNLKATQQKLRLNFERVRSRNIELEKNAKVQKALLTEAQKELKASSVESEKNYQQFINERFFCA